MKDDPLVVLVDTREQKPFRFDAETHGATCVREHLPTGDYTARGAEHLICIERKGDVGDLATCVGRERDRFERELERMLGFPRRYLLMEFTLDTMLRWHPPAGTDGATDRGGRRIVGTHLVGSVLAWSSRFGVQPLWCGSRALAAATLLKLLRFAVKDVREGSGAVARVAT